eukprot:5201532-Pleurochrysis_carterae.AAC.1
MRHPRQHLDLRPRSRPGAARLLDAAAASPRRIRWPPRACTRAPTPCTPRRSRASFRRLAGLAGTSNCCREEEGWRTSRC